MKPAKSARFNLLAALKKLSKDARQGRYFVKRGPIVWPTHNFDSHPYAISIQIDSCSIIKRDGIQNASLSLEIAAKMRSSDQNDIDDSLSDEIIEDAEIILMKLRNEQVGSDPVVFHVGDDASVTEFYDTEFQVQGIIVSFNVKF